LQSIAARNSNKFDFRYVSYHVLNRILYEKSNFIKDLAPLCIPAKVSDQGVVALGGHFAKLCQEVDFYEAIFFSLHINFQKEKKRQIL
jgi:hypothetical protein